MPVPDKEAVDVATSWVKLLDDNRQLGQLIILLIGICFRELVETAKVLQMWLSNMLLGRDKGE
jgi:hypothetical protein